MLCGPVKQWSNTNPQTGEFELHFVLVVTGLWLAAPSQPWRRAQLVWGQTGQAAGREARFCTGFKRQLSLLLKSGESGMTSSLQGEEGDAGQSWKVGWPTRGVGMAGHTGRGGPGSECQ
ncbi:hypothetical protein E2C01_034843 [Portunus trituberculatus]|uniref:Uncharacterized protein n=1 Tax=Portunus trituberculatus TaxID=210409 RepID=A0A5B7F6L3_PORTR|nr:hypothetical protein [Portunus trituberculatus]